MSRRPPRQRPLNCDLVISCGAPHPARSPLPVQDACSEAVVAVPLAPAVLETAPVETVAPGSEGRSKRERKQVGVWKGGEHGV